MTDTMDGPIEPVTDAPPTDLLDLDSPVEGLLERWLEESLAEIGDEPEGQEQVDRLLWVLRKVRQRRNQVTDAAQARIDLITSWEDDEKARLDRRSAHIEQVLEGWAQGEHEESGRKTWNLPAGVITVRARRGRIAVIGKETDTSLVNAVGALLPEAITTTTKVVPSVVKTEAEPGDVVVTNAAVAMGVTVPAGYEARHAILSDDEGSASIVPGVYFLVPVAGREGRMFSAVTE